MNIDLSRLDPLSRRHFAERMAMTTLGVSLTPLLGFGADKSASDEKPDLTKMPGFGKAKRVIWLQMQGGMSHIDTLDPKTGETKGASDPVTSKKGDFQLSGYLPKLAGQGDKISLIRSMTSKTGVHAAGQYVMRTGFEQRGTIKHPAMGAWAQHLLGPSHKTLPSSVCVNRNPDHGNGFFAAASSPLPIHDPEAGLQYAQSADGTDVLKKRLSLLDKIDGEFRTKFQDINLKAYTDFYDTTMQLMSSDDTKAFKLTDEPSELRDKYGRNKFGQGCLLARRLIEHDVRFVEVSHGSFDMHNDVDDAMQDKGGQLDVALAALLEDLSSRGLLDSTLVVLCSEFGRTPTINSKGGRDHYPKVFSTLLAGGGIKGGFVYGSSDKQGREVADKMATIQDFHATIGHVMGMNVEQVVMSPSGRPFTIANKGSVITEVMA